MPFEPEISRDAQGMLVIVDPPHRRRPTAQVGAPYHWQEAKERMKQGMRQLDGQRIRFTATIERFGEKSAFKGPPIPTILLNGRKA